MRKLKSEWKHGWDNTFYRVTTCYIAILVTIIFILQFHQCFSVSGLLEMCNQTAPSFSKLGSAVGVLLNAKF